MKTTIRSKIIACIAIGIFAIAIAANILVREAISKGFTDETVRMGIVVTQELAEQMVNPLLTGDIPQIQLKIYRAKQENENIEYIFLTDRNRLVFASTSDNDLSYNIAKLNPIPLNQNHATKHFHTKNTGCYDIAYRLLKSDLGELHIGFSEKNLTQAINNFNQRFLLILSTICLLGLGLGIYVAKHITDPLENLARKMEQVGNGDLSVSIEKLANDEIGLLGQTFNQMIQELKNSKEQIEQYSQTLEQRVRERTSELQNTLEQLKLAQEQMVQSEKLASIGQLAAGVSHELNNPLGGILGFSQYLAEKMRKKGLAGSTPDDFEYYIERLSQIEKASLRCKTIVENLLRFSRSSKSEAIPMDINQVLEDTLIFTKHQLEINKIELEKNLSPNLPQVSGNEQQLQQVFTNIMLNAQQAMSCGGKLSISTNHDNGSVEISFSDSGEGIAAENLSKIFDPFFTTKAVGKGTGLGLAISYGIIKNMGGTILVESREGQGSIFIIKIPAQ